MMTKAFNQNFVSFFMPRV